MSGCEKCRCLYGSGCTCQFEESLDTLVSAILPEADRLRARAEAAERDLAAAREALRVMLGCFYGSSCARCEWSPGEWRGNRSVCMARARTALGG